jgi:hypothetical protein
VRILQEKSIRRFPQNFRGSEIMKLCIKIDDWTKKKWETAKRGLENSIELEFGKPVTVSKLDVLQYLLVCFEHGSTPSYVKLFDKEEVEAMYKRNMGLIKKYIRKRIINR